MLSGTSCTAAFARDFPIARAHALVAGAGHAVPGWLSGRRGGAALSEHVLPPTSGLACAAHARMGMTIKGP